MNDIQETLNKVIDSGIYRTNDFSSLMCVAIGRAVSLGLVSAKEAIKTENAICEYIKPYGSLSPALFNNGLPYEFNDKLKIYKDWANRPKLNNEVF